MYVLSGSQSRAARGLLNWTRDELALKSNVSCGTIRSFENDTSIRPTTIQKLHQTFVEYGVDFLQTRGVQLRSKDVHDFTGPEASHLFFEFIGKSVNDRSEGVACILRDSEMMNRNTGMDQQTNLARLSALHEAGLHLRCLVTDQDKLPSKSAAFELRTLSEKTPTIPVSSFVFGNYWALGCVNDDRRNLTYIVLRNTGLVRMALAQFTACWDVAGLLKSGKTSKFPI